MKDWWVGSCVTKSEWQQMNVGSMKRFNEVYLMRFFSERFDEITVQLIPRKILTWTKNDLL